MTRSRDYINFIRDQLSVWKTVDTKQMFGCVGLYADDLMFGIISKNTIYFKVDDSNKNSYIKAGSETLTLFKSNSPVVSFYAVPAEILEDPSKCIEWANESLGIQKMRARKKQKSDR
tara:strand:+ start:2452 stop:2802 length:351 start_codon:yes stop_codon:yes gene_type:complete